jgi:hypothetical protein
MKRNACRANKFLLVPKPRLIETESFWGEEAPTVVEVIDLVREKIEVHRKEIADAEWFLNWFVEHNPQYAYLVPKRPPSLVVTNQRQR